MTTLTTKTKKNTSIETFIDSIENNTELFSKVSNLTPQEQALTMRINEHLAPLVNRANGWTSDSIKVLPTILTIQSHGLRRNCMGHYLQDAYTDKVTGESYAEIQISAEYLSRSLGETLTTTLHETVHLCSAQRFGFSHDDAHRDCTKDGKHRKDGFKKFCDAITIDGKPALEVEKGSKGWAHTYATPELLAWFDTLGIDPDLFNIYRNTAKPKAKKTSRNIKYECECSSFHATSFINATCNECGAEFLDSSFD